MEEIEFDVSIVEFFTENNAYNKLVVLQKLLNAIERYNSLQNIIDIDKTMDLDILEARTIDLVNEEIEEANIIAYILEMYKEATIEFFLRLGIIIEQEVYLYQLTDILNAMSDILELDTDYIEPILAQLENRDSLSNNVQAVYLFVDLISEYTQEDYSNIIRDVSDNVLEKIEEFLENKMTYSSLDLDPKLETDLTAILQKDSTFGRTIIYNQLLNEGLDITNLEVIKPRLYSILEKHVNEQYLIPYEIYLAMLLSGVKRPNMYGEFTEEIDLSLLSFIGEDANKEKSLKDNFEILAKNMLGVLSNEEE